MVWYPKPVRPLCQVGRADAHRNTARRRGVQVTGNSLLPHGENLRRAVRWLSDEGRHDAAAIEEAAVRFDLSPLEEDFLLREAVAARARQKETDPQPPE